MHNEDIKQDSKEIYDYLYEMASSQKYSYQDELEIRTACIEATAKIMQAKIIAQAITNKIF